MSEVPSTFAARLAGGTTVGDYIEILKPRVMSLVVFTGFVGLVVAPGHLHPVLAAIAILCIAVGAGASGAIDRLGSGDGRYRLGCGRAVRDHLLLDAAAFLGAVIVSVERIRGRRCPDAAGRRRSARDQKADAAVHIRAVAGEPLALAAR